jgi:hypothetical protein
LHGNAASLGRSSGAIVEEGKSPGCRHGHTPVSMTARTARGPEIPPTFRRLHRLWQWQTGCGSPPAIFHD